MWMFVENPTPATMPDWALTVWLPEKSRSTFPLVSLVTDRNVDRVEQKCDGRARHPQQQLGIDGDLGAREQDGRGLVKDGREAIRHLDAGARRPHAGQQLEAIQQRHRLGRADGDLRESGEEFGFGHGALLPCSDRDADYQRRKHVVGIVRVRPCVLKELGENARRLSPSTLRGWQPNRMFVIFSPSTKSPLPNNTRVVWPSDTVSAVVPSSRNTVSNTRPLLLITGALTAATTLHARNDIARLLHLKLPLATRGAQHFLRVERVRVRDVAGNPSAGNAGAHERFADGEALATR